MSQKIPCVVLVYYNVDEIRQTLEALFHPWIDIYVVENPTERTPEIKAMCLDYLDQGKIKSYILFEKNIAHNAVSTVFYDNLIPLEAPYAIVTDGDLIPDKGWLEEHIHALMFNPELFVIGTDLKMHNLPVQTFPESKGWVPTVINDRGDYLEAYCGHHLLTFRMEDFKNFLVWIKANNFPWLDSTIAAYCQIIHKRWGKTKVAKALHWTWTLYQDLNHPYTKYRLEFKNIWQSNNTSGYKVYAKGNIDAN